MTLDARLMLALAVWMTLQAACFVGERRWFEAGLCLALLGPCWLCAAAWDCSARRKVRAG